MTVEPIPVEVPTRAPGGRTNAYLVGDSPAVLVDPAGVTGTLDEAVAERDVAHVVVTHTHHDHVGGVAHYADEAGATVWALAGRERQFERATGVAPDRTFREGTTLPGADVRIVETPGHATDHVAFVTGDDALVGDLAMGDGSVVVGSQGGDMRAYLTSLRRLLARNYRTLYPGHGDPIPDSRDRLATLVAHRLDRERRVRAAVADGARDVEDVVDAAYEKDLSGVRDLAAETVRAHLAKLAVEGDLDWDPATDRVDVR